ncbi:MAG: NifU family protein [Bacteroidetes bacterium]|nr:MAG: NifU family protein [Bacteroidota bacterium]
MEKELINIYAEATPNPETMKFVANRMILPNDSADFQSREAALRSPLATALFEKPYVNAVFIMNNFVTVSKVSTFEWATIMHELRDFVKEWLEEGKEIMSAREEKLSEEEENEVVMKIKDLLDAHVKPAVEMDGGAISFKSFDEGVVKVVLKGSCSGCPSSTITLKAGIENLLKRMIPEVESVEAEAE